MLKPDLSTFRPRTSELTRFCVAMLVTVVAVLLSIAYVDRPVALWTANAIGERSILDQALTSEAILLVIGCASIALCGALALSGRALPRWAYASALAGFSVILGVVCNDMVLQPFFGRSNPSQYVYHHIFTFTFLHGRSDSGFPSGHSAMTAAFFGVLWQFYPPLRGLFAAVIVFAMVCLVIAQWHFVSDTIAGAFVGLLAARTTIALSTALKGYALTAVRKRR